MPRPLPVVVLLTALAAAIGFFMGRELRAAQRTPAVTNSFRAAEPNQPIELSPLEVSGANPAKPLRPIGADPSFKFTTSEQHFMSASTAQIWNEEKAAIRMKVDRECRRAFQYAYPDSYQPLCDKIFQTQSKTQPKIINNQQRFFRGEIDSTTFQANQHKALLEWAVWMEQALTPEEYLLYWGMPPGQDMFLIATAFFVDKPEGYHVGDDLATRPPELTAAMELNSKAPLTPPAGDPEDDGKLPEVMKAGREARKARSEELIPSAPGAR